MFLTIISVVQRGDSLDTIFASSPPSESERNRTKVKSKKRNSPRRRVFDQREESTDQENSQALSPIEYYVQGHSNAGGVVFDDVTGNIAHLSDSVVLTIENSSSASSSVSEIRLGDEEEVLDEEEQEDDDDDENDDEELHCDDWEIRMLAAELNRRESKRDEELFSSGTTSDGDGDESGLVRRRLRKPSDTFETDTEPSEAEIPNDQLARPRAASLDQHNLRREKAKGVFKAFSFSFDRDKDRL